jgi:hypothetical protein
MVWTIAPAVSGVERRRVLAVHVAGLLAGAITTCLVLVLVAGAVTVLDVGASAWLHGLSALVLLAWMIRAVTDRGLPYPRSTWQVPESWRARLPLKGTAVAYGYLLGLGPLTDVVLPTYWLLVGVTIAGVDGFVWAMLGWLAYGAARAATTVIGVRRYSTVCAVASTPAGSSIRPRSERTLLTTFTVILFACVAGSQLAGAI